MTTHALEARIARLEAEISGKPFETIADFPLEHEMILKDEILLYKSRGNELNSAKDILKQQLTQYKQGPAEIATQNTLSRNANS